MLRFTNRGFSAVNHLCISLCFTMCISVYNNVSANHRHAHLSVSLEETDSIIPYLKYYSATLPFEENSGEWSDSISYVLERPGGRVSFTRSSVDFSLFEVHSNSEANEKDISPAFNEEIQKKRDLIEHLQSGESDGRGAGEIVGHHYSLTWRNTPGTLSWSGIGKQSNTFNRYKSTGHTTGKRYHKEIWGHDLYDNIDVRFYSLDNGTLEYDYIIYPGGDWRDIVFQFAGIEHIEVTAKHTLKLETSIGVISISAPYTYQIKNGQEIPIQSGYVLNADNTLNISLQEEDIDPALPVIIDPVAVEWSTFYGGSRSDVLADLVQDQTGIYALFSTLSLDFPLSPGPFQVGLAGNQDLAVVRMSNTGEQLWSTYIGGSDFESANAIIVDEEGVYIVSESASEDYPTTPGAFQTEKAGFSNLVVSKLEKTRGTLEWSSYLGGAAFEFGANLIGGTNNIFITAYTGSNDYPTSAGAFQEGPVNLGENAVVTAINKDNGQLSWSTYFSISGVSRDAVLFTDGLISGDRLLLTGNSPRGLPTTANAQSAQNSGEQGGILVEFDQESGVLNYSSFIQNAGNYSIYQMIENGGQVFLYGQSGDGFSHSGGAFQSNFGGGNTDLILVALDKESKSINWSTYIGGQSNELTSFANYKRRSLVLIGDTVFVSGVTESRNFPTSSNAWQRETNFPVGQKFVLAAFNANSGDNAWSTYFSPIDPNAADDILLLTHEQNQLFSVGRTRTDKHFTSKSAFQTLRYGGFDLIAHEIDAQSGVPSCGSYIGGQLNEGLRNTFVLDGKVLLAGNAISADFPASSGAFQTSPGSDQESGYFTMLSPCCVDVLDNEIGPEEQTACRLATPQLIEGEDAKSFLGYPDIIRGGATFPQDGSARTGQYIWQRSIDGEDWSNIPGARDRSFQPETLVEDRFFRRIFGCDTSNVVQVRITEDEAPTVDPGGPFVLCPDGTVQLGGMPTVSMANGPYSIQWQPADALDNAMIDNPTAMIDRNVIFEVEVIDDANCRVVRNTPVYLIEPYTGQDRKICIGDTIRLGNSPLPPVEEVIYEWEVISGDVGAIIGNPSSPRPLISPDQTTVFRLTTTFDGNCSFEEEVTVEVVTVPLPDAGDDKVICSGEPIIIGPEDSDSETLSYEWFPKRGLNNFNIANPEFNGRPTGECNVQTFVLEIKDKEGVCPGRLDSIDINIIVADAGKDACGPRRIGSPDGSCGRDTYQWEVIEGDFASLEGQENLAQPFVDPDSPTRYRLTVSFEDVECVSEVFVPGCKCPQIDPEFFIPVNCETLEQDIPFCIQLPESDGFDISLIDGDDFVDITGEQLCLVQPITGNRTYQLLFEKGFVSCVSTVTFILDLPEPPTIEEDSIFICPANQQGNTIQIGISAEDGYTYKWRPATGLSDVDVATTTLDWTILPERQNTYTLEVKHEASGCVYPLQVKVFNRSPNANAGNDQDFCGGIFTVLGTPDRSNFQYSWSPEDGLDDINIAQPELSLFEGPGSYTYSVTVTDPETGCEDTDEVTLRILENITADAGEDKTICLGETVQLGDANAPTEGYVYRWEPGDGLSSTTVPSPSASPVATTTYTLIVSLDGTNPCDAIDEVTIVVNPSTEVEVDLGPDLVICEPGELTIGPEPEDGLIYSWAPTVGLSDPNAAMPTATIDSSIAYSLTIVNREDCTIGTGELQITIDSLPTLAGPDLEICQGDSIMIGMAPLDGVTYSWTPAQAISDPNSPNPRVFPEETTRYTIVAQRGDCVFQDSILVTVNERPVADAGEDMTVCDEAVVIGPSQVEEDWIYSWSPSTGLSSTFLPNPTASPVSEAQYLLTVSTPSGCFDIDSVTVTPPFEIDLGQTAYSVCLGDTIEIGPDFLDNDADFEWRPIDLLINPESLRPLFASSEPGTFETELRVIKNGCSQTFTFTINVEDPGSIDLDQNALNACKNGCVETTVQVNGVFTDFYWSPTDGVETVDQPNTIICPEDDQIYVLTGINEFNQCLARDTLLVRVREVEAPVADAGPDRALCIGETTLLGSEPIEGISYEWTPGNFLTGTSTATPLFTALIGGRFDYTLLIYDEATFCTNIDNVSVDVIDFTIDIQAPDSICAGQPFELSALIVDNALELDINEFSFSWSPADVLEDGFIQNPIATIEETTVFEVTATHLPSGCQQVVFTTVVVNGDAIPEFDLPNDILVCDIDQPYQIPFEAEPGFTYTWLPAFRLSNTNIANPTIQTPIPVGAVYQLTIEDTSRTDACRFFVHRVQLTETNVIQLPDRDYLYCDMSLDSILIGSETPSVPAGYSILWIPSNGLSTDQEEQTMASALLPAVYSMILTREDTPERLFASCETSSQHNLLPQPLPIVRTGADQGLCGPGSIRIGGASDPGLQYMWSPASALDRIDIPRPTATVDQSTTFTLEVTDAFGCTNEDTVDVVISDIDIELVLFQDASCDEDDGGLIEVEATGGLPPYSYSWSTIGGSGIMQGSPSQINLTTGEYFVTATDAAGCEAFAEFVIDEEGECCDTIIFTYIPEDLTINCDAVFPTSIPAAENHCCEGGIQVQEALLHAPLDCPQNEVFTRVFTVTDACGNEVIIEQSITVLDLEGPVFDFCQDLSNVIHCKEDNDGAIESWHLNNLDILSDCARDNCSDIVLIESNYDLSLFEPGCSGTGQISVTYFSFDLCGNAGSSAEFTLTIIDETPPDLSNCPVLDLTASCEDGDLTQVANAWHAANTIALMDCAEETCSSMVILTHNFNVNNVNTDGCASTLEVTYAAMDLCGNVSDSYTATLNIVNDTAPDISACSLPDETVDCSTVDFPSDLIIWHNENLNLLSNCAIDNCGADIIVTSDFDVDNFVTICGATGSITISYTVSDDCGNATEQLFATWSIGDDNNLDILSCNLVLDTTIDCSLISDGFIESWHLSNLAAVEDCGSSPCNEGVDVSSDFDPESFVITCGVAGSITVNYSLSDGCSAAVEVLSATLTILDTIAPNLDACDLPSEALFSCNIDEIDIIQDWHQNNINVLLDCVEDCGEDFSVLTNFDNLNIEVGCGVQNSYVITYAVQDACGNISEDIEIDLIIEPIDEPDISECAILPVAINCADGDLEIQANDWHQSNLSFLSECGNAPCNNIVDIIHDFSFQPMNLDCDSENTIIVNYQLVDICGFISDTISAELIIEQPPIIDIEACDLDLDLIAECTMDIAQTAGDWHDQNLTSIMACLSDICMGGFTIEHNFDFELEGDICEATGPTIVEYIIFNACQDTVANIAAQFSVLDSQPPVITWNEDDYPNIQSGDTLWVQCASNTEGWELPSFGIESVSAEDECQEEVFVDISEEIIGPGNCAEDGYFFNIRCVWTASDACENTDSLVLHIIVIDTIPPVIHNVPEDVTLTCDDLPPYPELTVCPDDPDICCESKVWTTDECECAELFFEEDINFVDCNTAYTVVRRWTAIDNCGNSTIEEQIITVLPSEDTQLIPLHDMLLGVSVGDSLQFECGASASSLPDWVLMLDEGHVMPLNTCPGVDYNVEYGLFLIESDPDCTEGFVEHWMLVWTLQSECGQTVQYFIDIFIVDTRPPEIIGSVEVCVDHESSIEVFDDCSIATTSFTDNPIPSICIDGGLDVNRLWIAEDACGNISTFEQRIINPDGGNEPVIVSNNPQLDNLSSGDTLVLSCQPHHGGWTQFSESDISITGICEHEMPITFTETLIAHGSCDQGFIYEVLISWMSEDPCFGEVQVEYVVRLVDDQPPVFSEDFILLTCGEVIRDPIVEDACSDFVLEIQSEEWGQSANCQDEYTLFRTYIAEDECGNMAEQLVEYTILRQGIDIVFEGIGQEVLCQPSPVPEVSALDPCTGESLEVSFSTEMIYDPCIDAENELRIWQVTDVCGVQHTRTQLVQVSGTVQPIISWSHPTVSNVASGSTIQLSCFAESDLEAKIERGFSEDNLTGVHSCEIDINLHREPVEIEPCIISGILEKEKLTWSATDACGNINTFELFVEWLDEEPPIFISPVTDLMIGCGEVPAPETPEIYENCGSLDLSFSENRSFTQQGELITRVWTATDDCGNTATQTNTITVIDATSLSCDILKEADPVCISSGNALSVAVEGGIEPYTYEWEVTGGVCEIQEGADTPHILYHIGFSPANIKVTITDATGCQVECSIQLNCVIDPKDRSEMQVDANEVVIGRITPNPTDGALFVQYYTNDMVPGDIRIIDAYGTIVDRIQTVFSRDERELRLNINRLPAGLYYIVFNTPDKEVRSRKIIKY